MAKGNQKQQKVAKSSQKEAKSVQKQLKAARKWPKVAGEGGLACQFFPASSKMASQWTPPLGILRQQPAQDLFGPPSRPGSFPGPEYP